VASSTDGDDAYIRALLEARDRQKEWMQSLRQAVEQKTQAIAPTEKLTDLVAIVKKKSLGAPGFSSVHFLYRSLLAGHARRVLRTVLRRMAPVPEVYGGERQTTV
jgi:hypothetical protein